MPDQTTTRRRNPPRDRLEPLDVLYRKGAYAQTLEAARALQPDYPDAPILPFIEGLAHAGLGQHDAALACYDRTLTLAPAMAEAHYNSGLMYRARNDLARAMACYHQALHHRPDHVPSHYNLGNLYKDTGQPDRAMARYRRVLELKPGHPKACGNLGMILQDQGDTEGAIALYRAVLADNPDHGTARHMLSALQGDTPKAAPRAYVETLFDDYAHSFDASLLSDLDYRAPRLMAELLRKTTDAGGLGRVLDLGCGTGLSGQVLRDQCQHLTGVDLSQKMLDQARAKAIYDALEQADLIGYLSAAPLAFDTVVALDVLIYLGDLEPVFHHLATRAPRPLRLAFTTEDLAEGTADYRLLPSGRYAHRRTYIEALAHSHGFAPTHIDTAPLRMESGTYLTGGVYLFSR